MKSKINNRIRAELNKIFPKNFHIAAKREFFEEIGIGQKRWNQLLREEKQATPFEIKQVSRYFKIPLEKLIQEKPEKSKSLNN